ncbi:hypothetical protein [Roseateles sp.]|jgi:hypothetical protein|uniref:hypothetical protein n=1 Tax=Roseateles sp. TaxID=1971397 RepID=UPI0037C977F1
MPSPAVRSLVLPLALPLLLTLHTPLAGAQPECPERIRVVYIDAAAEPFFRGVGQAIPEPPGLFVEWTRNALQRLECTSRASFERLPPGRIAHLAPNEGQGFDLLLGVAQSSPLAELLRMPAAPSSPQADLSVAWQELFLYARADDPPEWDGNRLKLKAGQSIGGAANTVMAAVVASRGWPLEPAANHETALRKALARRSAAVLLPTAYVDQRIARQDPSVAGLVKLTPAVLSERYYAAATAHFHRRHRDFVHRFWVEMCKQGNALRAKPLSCPLSALQDS